MKKRDYSETKIRCLYVIGEKTRHVYDNIDTVELDGYDKKEVIKAIETGTSYRLCYWKVASFNAKCTRTMAMVELEKNCRPIENEADDYNYTLRKMNNKIRHLRENLKSGYLVTLKGGKTYKVIKAYKYFVNVEVNQYRESIYYSDITGYERR